MPRINTGQHGLMHEAITEKVIGVFYEVYNELGHGFLESVYEAAMEIALRASGLQVERQKPIDVFFRGQRVGHFCADLIVNGIVIIELKAVANFDRAFEAQLLNYLRATQIEVGLLLNFGPKPLLKRYIFTNDRKSVPLSSIPEPPLS